MKGADMRWITLSMCAELAAACTSDALDPDHAAEVGAASLPPPGSLSAPIEGFAVYEPSIDTSNECGDASMRTGPRLFSDCVAACAITANTYATCGGFHAVGQAL